MEGEEGEERAGIDAPREVVGAGRGLVERGEQVCWRWRWRWRWGVVAAAAV